MHNYSVIPFLINKLFIGSSILVTNSLDINPIQYNNLYLGHNLEVMTNIFFLIFLYCIIEDHNIINKPTHKNKKEDIYENAHSDVLIYQSL